MVKGTEPIGSTLIAKHVNGLALAHCVYGVHVLMNVSIY